MQIENPPGAAPKGYAAEEIGTRLRPRFAVPASGIERDAPCAEVSVSAW